MIDLEKTLDIIQDRLNGLNSFVVNEIELIRNKKLSIVLTYNDLIMMSVEVLPDCTCDLMVVEIKSEELLDTETKYFNHDQMKMIDYTIEYLRRHSQLSK